MINSVFSVRIRAYRVRIWSPSALCAAVVLFLSIATSVSAQNIPDETAQKGIIRSSLSTFNDANLSGNYAVLYALLSKPFREQFSEEKLKTGFAEFNKNQIDISEVLVAEPVVTKPTTVDKDGVMTTTGYFDTSDKRVSYTLRHLLSDGKWKLLGLNVDTSALPAK